MASTVSSRSIRTVLLYCPYDRRVTRHARRGPQLRLVCLDCGRGLNEEHEAPPKGEALRQPAPVPVAVETVSSPEAAAELALAVSPRSRPRPGPGESSRSPRPASPRRRGQGPSSWHSLPVALAGAVLTLLGAVNVLGNVVAPKTPDGIMLIEGIRLDSEGTVYVANTEGEGVYLRRTPSIDDRSYAVPEGTQLDVLGPDVSADGVVWRPVEDPSGKRGWVPAHYTALAP